ncbi:chromate transporter [bacterium]|jgi:chromate transporter|nr:chromate transporter [bacterium]
MTKKDKFLLILELYWTFFKIGLFTFGGGFSMLSLIHSVAIEKKKWISEEELLDIIAIAESTPGPIAINTATFVGFKKAGVLGGVFTTFGVATPSIIIISIIAYFYESFAKFDLVQKAFKGILCCVAVLIFGAALKLFKTLSKRGKLYVTIPITLGAFALALLTSFSSIFMIIIGAIIGFVFYTFLIKEEQS